MAGLAFSAASERNKVPILAVLRDRFAACRTVLEIGSGTGQHAVFFAGALPQLHWIPSERPAALGDLEARIRAEAPANCAEPLAIDVRDRPWPAAAADGVFTANTLHIMSWPEVEAFFAGLADVLNPGGTLCVYGPFRYGDTFAAPSNAVFDRSLRSRDPASGIRSFAAVDKLAGAQGLVLEADHAMPANNQLLVWRLARG